ncbi:hypothetical protein EJ02DRAFT_470601 [Clathrospora elynae]|uniref:Uncharacterized protein n=1 Tax=Clathrospora elynae TaxID=706981 RepID=A0A6A5SCP4_9PLEO|nr:hypothetical protein EJ02DRAFT_470601 [Clathrospora elynae]
MDKVLEDLPIKQASHQDSSAPEQQLGGEPVQSIESEPGPANNQEVELAKSAWGVPMAGEHLRNCKDQVEQPSSLATPDVIPEPGVEGGGALSELRNRRETGSHRGVHAPERAGDPGTRDWRGSHGGRSLAQPSNRLTTQATTAASAVPAKVKYDQQANQRQRSGTCDPTPLPLTRNTRLSAQLAGSKTDINVH